MVLRKIASKELLLVAAMVTAMVTMVPSHCGIDGNEKVDELAKETLDQDIDPLASVHCTDVKPLVNSYI